MPSMIAGNSEEKIFHEQNAAMRLSDEVAVLGLGSVAFGVQ